MWQKVIRTVVLAAFLAGTGGLAWWLVGLEEAAPLRQQVGYRVDALVAVLLTPLGVIIGIVFGLFAFVGFAFWLRGR